LLINWFSRVFCF